MKQTRSLLAGVFSPTRHANSIRKLLVIHAPRLARLLDSLMYVHFSVPYSQKN